MESNLILILGIISGVAVLNIVLGTMWILFHRRNRQQSRRSNPNLTSAPVKLIKIVPNKRDRISLENPSSYLQLVMSIQSKRASNGDLKVNKLHRMTPPNSPMSPQIQETDLSKGRQRNALKRLERIRTDIEIPSMPPPSLKPENQPFSRSSSVVRRTSVLSDDSASVYSSLSAPPEAYTQEHGSMFQSIALRLETIPASPNSLKVEETDHAHAHEEGNTYTWPGLQQAKAKQELNRPQQKTSHVVWNSLEDDDISAVEVDSTSSDENNDVETMSSSPMSSDTSFVINTPYRSRLDAYYYDSEVIPPVPPLPAYVFSRADIPLETIPEHPHDSFMSNSQGSTSTLSIVIAQPPGLEGVRGPAPTIPARSPLRAVRS